MLTKIPHSKSEAKRLAVQLAANQRKLEKEREKPKIAPIPSPDPNLPICVLIDIDGVLAKRSERGIFDFDKSINDKPFLQVVYILRLIDDANRYINNVVGKTHIILITGREDRFKDVTNKWLNEKWIPFDKLFMRRTGDRRDAAIVKEEIWAGNIRNQYNVLFAIEDTQKVIDKYRELGIYCLIADNSRE